MKKLPKLSEKLKKDKKLLLTVAAGILGIVFIVISEFIPKSSYKKAETGEQNKNSVSSYEETLEKRLESIISSVDGAGRVPRSRPSMQKMKRKIPKAAIKHPKNPMRKSLS